MKTNKRCNWPDENPLMIEYHDKEWGAPLHDDRKIFEFLILESAQAGLSWITILRKRENYRKAFAQFNPRKVARFGKKDVVRLLKNPGIIRNRLKIEATINNAQRFLEVQKEFGSFSKYMWSFVEGTPIDGKRKRLKDLPAVTKEAEIFARDLKQRGFKFLGPTVIYAHMQAVGMVNDHITTCFRYKETTQTKKLHNADAQTLFEPIAKVFLKQSGVAEKMMFGTTALTNKGKVFAFSWKGNLVVKLPKEQVAEIVVSKKGIYFDPGHGRISKEWVAIAPSTQNEWINLTKEAKEFVVSIKK